MPSMRRFIPLVFVGVAGTVGAQSISARVAPQYVSYTINAPSNLKITELAVPMFVMIGMGQSVSLDVGTSFASIRAEQTGSTSPASTITGLTDTQVRANVTLGS